MSQSFIHIVMRTNIVIDDALMDSAMRLSGLPSKRATVEAALQELVRRAKAQAALREMRGMGWEGDLDAMRRDRG